jgi:large subunit ribosomal protein L29
MNAKELRTKDPVALTKELRDLQRAHFSLRMQLATQQITNTSQLGKTKRDVARVKTIINEAARKATSK